MTPNLIIQEPSLVQVAQQDFTVSVLLPFAPRAMAKKNVEAAIKLLQEEVETKLTAQAGRQTARQVCSQLKELFDQLDYGVNAQSAALWANTEKGKMAYWQIPVHPAVEISPEFDVRKLLVHQKEEKQYLLLGMGDHFGGIYLGNGKSISRLVANAPVSAGAGRNTEALGSAAQQQQAALERSVKHFDTALSILQKAYNLPVFIVAPSLHLSCFHQMSGNAKNATALIEVPASINEYGLQQVIAPYIRNWQQLKEARLQVQLDQAMQAGKLAVGIGEVWTAAVQKRGRLLVVEQDYVYPAYIDMQGAAIYADAIPLSQTSRQTADAVSEAMAIVLANGGKVETVSKGALADYVHIAMICY